MTVVVLMCIVRYLGIVLRVEGKRLTNAKKYLDIACTISAIDSNKLLCVTFVNAGLFLTESPVKN